MNKRLAICVAMTHLLRKTVIRKMGAHYLNTSLTRAFPSKAFFSFLCFLLTSAFFPISAIQ
jgi:hypothetical protein